MIHISSATDLQAYLDGGWFERIDGVLYVVPLGEREAWGPDDDVMTLLVMGSWETSWPRLMREHELALVQYERRRWSSRNGFYQEK